MKIKPVIMCGGAGTRLWPQSKNNLPKQFIDFGGWNLFEKSIQRIKNSIFDYPIISTNSVYVNLVRKYLIKHKINKFRIVLEPSKKNTAPAILTSTLLSDIPDNQTVIFLSADHLIEKINQFNKSIASNKKHLNDSNIFIFGIKPTSPSPEYGYFLTKRVSKGLNKVTRFIEKPDAKNAKKIIRKKGHWNSGMFFAKKSSIVKHFKKLQPGLFKLCYESVNKKNVFYRPWGKYTNLYSGKKFLVKELVINPKSSISLQKHTHRSEHWTVISGKPKITINNKKFFKEADETAFIPKGSIHRIENFYHKPVKIMEVQTGQILKETDIIRYKDIYGRIN